MLPLVSDSEPSDLGFRDKNTTPFALHHTRIHIPEATQSMIGGGIDASVSVGCGDRLLDSLALRALLDSNMMHSCLHYFLNRGVARNDADPKSLPAEGFRRVQRSCRNAAEEPPSGDSHTSLDTLTSIDRKVVLSRSIFLIRTIHGLFLGACDLHVQRSPHY